MSLLIAVVLAYLLGSVSFAVVVSRLSGLDDPRSYGSGNPGATNVLRTGNRTAAALTLLGDMLKGTLAIVLARVAGFDEVGVDVVALAVFSGHLYPVFLGFKGGKGVATAAGVLLALNPWLGLGALASWIFVAVVFRYSSLAAMVAALSAPLWAFLLGESLGSVLTVSFLAFSLLVRHRANITRLLAGQETRIGKK